MVPEYPPEAVGGGAAVFQALARGFAARNEVRIFTAWDGVRAWSGDRVVESRPEGEVLRYPLAPLGRGAPHLCSVVPPAPGLARALWRDLRAYQPEVAHLHGYGHAIIDLAAWALRRSSTPYVFTFHGVPVSPARRGVPVRAAYRVYESTVLRRTVAGAGAATAVSPSAAGHLGIRFRPEIIPNGFTTLPPVDPAGASRLRANVGIAPGLPLVVALGRLAHSKGFDVLIRAIPLLKRRDARCVIAGADGGEGAALRALATKECPGRVIFAGRLDREDSSTLLAAASVVAIPSRAEPFGLVALEALQMDRRVVATAVGGLAMTLQTPGAALVPPGDPAALARELDIAITAGAWREDERAAARDVLRRFHWKEIVPAYERVLRDCERSPVP